MAEATAEGALQLAPAVDSGHEPDRKRLPLPEQARAWARNHRRAVLFILLATLVIVVAALIWLFHYFSTFESTDDAQVDGNISEIGPRIAGAVIAVDVQDNDRVSPGVTLVQLDPTDYEVAVAQAEANLELAINQRAGQVPSVPITNVTNRTSIATNERDVASARAQVAGAERDQEAAEAQLKEAEADSRLAQIELVRSEHLVNAGAVSPQDYDQRRATADSRAAAVRAAQANAKGAAERVAEARARLAASEEQLNQSRENAAGQVSERSADVRAREAAVRAAQAALEQAKLNLSYTRIVTPVPGIVGDKSVNVGDRVEAGQGLLGIVQVDNLWITANFKETDLRCMHPGQKADVKVDALGRTYKGYVESMPGATGARFSLLPPENATGNYVKVVQRLPIRIRLYPGQKDMDRLRPGMSVEPKVWLD